jgi:hypothetical protein
MTPSSDRSRPCRSVLLFLAWSLAAACASTLPEGPFRLWAVASDGEARPITDPLRWEADGFRIEVQPLTTEQRGRWLAQHAQVDRDPLSGSDLTALVTFRVRIKATGDLPVHIETQHLRLLAEGKGGGTAPIDYTRAYELLGPDQRDQAYRRSVEQFMRGLLDGSIDVPPGRVREGLLVFPDPSAEARLLVLHFPFVQVGAETHRNSVPFEKMFESELAAVAGEGSGR